MQTSRVRELREMLGLSLRKMALLLETSPAAICRWESGARFPSYGSCEKLVALAATYEIQITLEWLRPK